VHRLNADEEWLELGNHVEADRALDNITQSLQHPGGETEAVLKQFFGVIGPDDGHVGGHAVAEAGGDFQR
jgi:hypothetical protein